MNGRQWDNNHTRYHCSDGSGSPEKLQGGSQGLYRGSPDGARLSLLGSPSRWSPPRWVADFRFASFGGGHCLRTVRSAYEMSIPSGWWVQGCQGRGQRRNRHCNSGAEVFSAMYCRVHLFGQRERLASQKWFPSTGNELSTVRLGCSNRQS